jgi:hypothetical protein
MARLEGRAIEQRCSNLVELEFAAANQGEVGIVSD